MENLQNLLNSVNAILQEEKIKKEESLRRGERFNMFQVCGVNHYEVMHSAIIASFLDPNGSHGQMDKYLKAFLQTVDDKTEIETSSSSVYTEYVTLDGRIDILIEDKKGKGIIIENKVYASDQSEQLKRYDKFSKEKYKVGNYAIYYLTLDEHDASDDSGKGINYTCISYKEHILNWIGECIKESATTPLIRETLIQYRNQIKQLTNQDMDTENREKMIEILTSSNNIDTTIEILKKASDIYKQVRQNFINKLKAFTEEEGLRFVYDEGIIGLSNNCWIRITDDNYKGVEFRIGVSKHTNNDGFRMDFITNPQIENIEGQKKFWDQGYDPTNANPVGWTYLWSSSGMQNSGMWWRWDHMNTIEDMINGEMLEYFKKQIKDIKERKIFAELYELLNKQNHN